MESQRKKNVGRPAAKDGEQVKADLMEAARQHFLKREFKAVSVREIAQSAGVNGAMVSYYFGSKQGLYIAMVQELMGSLEESLAELGDENDLTVTDFSRIYARVLVANPWWPNFLAREVLFQDGETRDAIVGQFASALAPRILKSIGLNIENGNYRKDLDPQLAMISMIGLTVFPFLAKPLFESVLHRNLDGNTVEQLVEHNIKLFHQGVLDH